MSGDRMKCAVCAEDFSFQWGDQHGRGVCTTCGTPYVIFHYEDDKRVDKAPEVYLNETGMTLARAYWNEKRRRVFPGVLDMGLSHSRGCTYSGATAGDIADWNEWMESVGKKLVPTPVASEA